MGDLENIQFQGKSKNKVGYIATIIITILFFALLELILVAYTDPLHLLNEKLLFTDYTTPKFGYYIIAVIIFLCVPFLTTAFITDKAQTRKMLILNWVLMPIVIITAITKAIIYDVNATEPGNFSDYHLYTIFLGVVYLLPIIYIQMTLFLKKVTFNEWLKRVNGKANIISIIYLILYLPFWLYPIFIGFSELYGIMFFYLFLLPSLVYVLVLFNQFYINKGYRKDKETDKMEIVRLIIILVLALLSLAIPIVHFILPTLAGIYPLSYLALIISSICLAINANSSERTSAIMLYYINQIIFLIVLGFLLANIVIEVL